MLVNLIGTRVFGRLDLTENQVYTLSPALEGDRQQPARLPDGQGVHLEGAAARADRPSAATCATCSTSTATYSKGKLRFEALDPGDDKKIEDEAGQCKVQKLQMQVMRSQKFEVGSYYLGLCFQYQGKDEAIPQVDAGRGARVPDLVAASSG